MVFLTFCNCSFVQVFVRELISNASDAMEKLRYLQLSNTPGVDPQKPLEIQILAKKSERIFEIKVGDHENKLCFRFLFRMHPVVSG